MPDRRQHRGPHPADAELFGPAALPALRAATCDLAWLLERDYTLPASVKLVGDRHGLRSRQRDAVVRGCVTDAACERRARTQLPEAALATATLLVDGLNVLTTLEVALGGGVVVIGRDGVARDIAGVHGTYRRVQETPQALQLLADVCAELEIGHCHFLLDRPVSNSGRLRGFIDQYAASQDLSWEVSLVPDPDRELIEATAPIATADGEVLDAGGPWFNLAHHVITTRVDGAFVVDLRGPCGNRT